MISWRLWRAFAYLPKLHPICARFAPAADVRFVPHVPTGALIAGYVITPLIAVLLFRLGWRAAALPLLTLWIVLGPVALFTLPVWLPLVFNLALLATTTRLSALLRRERAAGRWELLALVPPGRGAVCWLIAAAFVERRRYLDGMLTVLLAAGAIGIVIGLPLLVMGRTNATTGLLFVTVALLYCADAVQTYILALVVGARGAAHVNSGGLLSAGLFVATQTLVYGLGLATFLLVTPLVSDLRGVALSVGIMADAALRFVVVCGVRELIIGRLATHDGSPLLDPMPAKALRA